MRPKRATEDEAVTGSPHVTRRRAVWNYVFICTCNVVLFLGAGIAYAYLDRPLADQGPVIVPVFGIAGLAWGWWLARRVNRGREDL